MNVASLQVLLCLIHCGDLSSPCVLFFSELVGDIFLHLLTGDTTFQPHFQNLPQFCKQTASECFDPPNKIAF